MFIFPFQRLPQTSQLVLQTKANNIWFCIIEYPSNGTFESDFDDVDGISNFVFFVIFCCDGKDERIEDVVRFDAVVCAVDMFFDRRDDISIRLFGGVRVDVFFLLHLILKIFYYNKNNYQIKPFFPSRISYNIQ